MFGNVKKCVGKIAAFAVIFGCLFTGCSKSKTEAATDTVVPERIVSLSPAATEILFAVGAGDKVVAVDEFSDYPEEVIDLPKIGGFDGKTLSIEKILSFEPDFVYLTDGMHNFLIDSLEKYNIDYYISTGRSVDEVVNEISDLGKITDNEKTAKKVVAGIEKSIKSASKNISDSENKPSVYYEVWNNPYMSIGGDTFISDVIAKAGGKNIFSDLIAWPSVSEESIIAANPDVIIIPISSGITVEDVGGRTGWSDISAVKNNKIFIVDDNLYSRPSPRIGETITQLSELLK